MTGKESTSTERFHPQQRDFPARASRWVLSWLRGCDGHLRSRDNLVKPRPKDELQHDEPGRRARAELHGDPIDAIPQNKDGGNDRGHIRNRAENAKATKNEKLNTKEPHPRHRRTRRQSHKRKRSANQCADDHADVYRDSGKRDRNPADPAPSRGCDFITPRPRRTAGQPASSTGAP